MTNVSQSQARANKVNILRAENNRLARKACRLDPGSVRLKEILAIINKNKEEIAYAIKDGW